MKIELNDGAAWSIVAICAAVAICLSVIFSVKQVQETERTAMQAGLVQKRDGDYMAPLWTKP